MNGYKWKIAFLMFHVVLRPYGKSAIFIYTLCTFKAIQSTGKIGKKCLQLLPYRQLGYNDNSRSRNKQSRSDCKNTGVVLNTVKFNSSP